jgi:Zn-dependent protease with chaperone function
MTSALRGRWFDGRSSAARAVAVRLQPGPRGPSLALQAQEGPALLLRHDQVRWPERWSAGQLPRKLVIDLGASGSLELDDTAGWQQALAAAGHRGTLAQAMQTRWSVLLAVLLAAALLLLAFYRWGTPWAATQLTRQVPAGWESELSQRVLHDLDARWLQPSQLARERQDRVRARFDAIARDVPRTLRRYPAYEPRFTLQFRRGMGANAFALPGGTVVVTDGIVELADRKGLGDDALAGVLAHEIGHVLNRHATRLVVEQGVLNVGLGLALGDVSWLLSTGGSLLTGLAYRRGHETEADCFAVAVLRRTGTPTQPMADLLLQIDAGAKEDAGWMEALSSHPATGERARALQSGGAPGCR